MNTKQRRHKKLCNKLKSITSKFTLVYLKEVGPIKYGELTMHNIKMVQIKALDAFFRTCKY
jgi:hypothetical protein